jgi:hypothetical protein
MRVAASSALCDAVELAALVLDRQLSQENLVSELTSGVPADEVQDLIKEALGVAAERAVACPQGYPFEVSERVIRAKSVDEFNPYLFLLLGSSLKHGGVANVQPLTTRFRKHFEDLVCWSLRTAGFTAEVLSEPRAERGLHKSLKPALLQVRQRFGEKAKLVGANLTADDNDLGVDVLATFPLIDSGRSGRPVFLFQCATGPVEELESKITEKQNVFAGVWQRGFYSVSSVRGGATPDDLLKLGPVYWHRLSEHGWVIDRIRIVQLAHSARGGAVPVPGGLLKLWNDLLSVASDLDWRNGWRHSLE